MISRLANTFGTFVVCSFDTPLKWLAALVALIWSCIEPTFPFYMVCTAFVFIDCISAWMLARRVKKYYPKEAKEGKFNSEHASNIFSTLCMIYMLIAAGYWLDTIVLDFVDVKVSNWVAAAFCLVQLISILENSSSCNGALWARVLQNVLVDKTSRHLHVNIEKEIEKAKQQMGNDKHNPNDNHNHNDNDASTHRIIDTSNPNYNEQEDNT